MTKLKYINDYEKLYNRDGAEIDKSKLHEDTEIDLVDMKWVLIEQRSGEVST